eukprot:TRINITY_DN40856_c0_g1_i1.p2 TRINITY_DN40856_c0_g1~~TRINITY_DN40856_c0_g1_i1.p2  ORF type:complete len:110 (+),score=3.43 TRINITY_DN40856_c0_g1_i1:194-523(+)
MVAAQIFETVSREHVGDLLQILMLWLFQILRKMCKTWDGFRNAFNSILNNFFREFFWQTFFDQEFLLRPSDIYPCVNIHRLPDDRKLVAHPPTEIWIKFQAEHGDRHCG